VTSRSTNDDLADKIDANLVPSAENGVAVNRLFAKAAELRIKPAAEVSLKRRSG